MGSMLTKPYASHRRIWKEKQSLLIFCLVHSVLSKSFIAVFNYETFSVCHGNDAELSLNNHYNTHDYHKSIYNLA
jgi:hypothetical protein